MVPIGPITVTVQPFTGATTDKAFTVEDEAITFDIINLGP